PTASAAATLPPGAPAPPPPPGPRAHRRARLLPLALVLLAGAAAIWLSLRPPAIEDPLVASGTIEADEVAIAAEVGGRLIELTVDEGSPVQLDQVVGRLDDALIQVQLRQADPAQR